MKYFLLIIFSINSVLHAQNINAFYIGHSLSDQIPDMVKSLADDHEGVQFDWAYQGIPGAPLRWQWERKYAQDYIPNPPYYYGFYDTAGGLPTGDFDVLVLTESVPRYGEYIQETYSYADSFFRYANNYHSNIQVYLYEDWHCIKSGTPTACDYDIDSHPWRQRITDDLPMWESVVDTLNNRYNPVNPVCLIPAAQGLARVYDSIYAGLMPGLSRLEDIFFDDIHLNDIGKYFVACVHFATILKTTPQGLTNQLQVWWGGDFDAPSPELALKFQKIAWDVATSYRKSCIDPAVSIQKNNAQNLRIKLYPNPANNYIYIEKLDNQLAAEITIYTPLGKKILTSKNRELNISFLSPGMYLLKSGDLIMKFIKQ